jgi:hypothetical protein
MGSKVNGLRAGVAVVAGEGIAPANVQRPTLNVQRSIQRVVEVLVPSTCSSSFGG